MGAVAGRDVASARAGHGLLGLAALVLALQAGPSHGAGSEGAIAAVAADALPAAGLWDQLSERWSAALQPGGDPVALHALLAREGRRVDPRADAPGAEIRELARDGARLELHLPQALAMPASRAGGEDGRSGADAAPLPSTPADGPSGAAVLPGAVDMAIMRWSAGSDTRLPPLGLRLRHCSDASNSACDELRFTHRSDLTLGAVACSCPAPAQVAQLDGAQVALIPCYLGRGGSYLNYAFAWDDPSGELAAFLNPDEAPSVALCLASEAYRDHPRLMQPYTMVSPLDAPPEIDTLSLPVAALVWDGETADLATSLRAAGGSLQATQ